MNSHGQLDVYIFRFFSRGVYLLFPLGFYDRLGECAVAVTTPATWAEASSVLSPCFCPTHPGQLPAVPAPLGFREVTGT